MHECSSPPAGARAGRPAGGAQRGPGRPRGEELISCLLGRGLQDDDRAGDRPVGFSLGLVRCLALRCPGDQAYQRALAAALFRKGKPFTWWLLHSFVNKQPPA